ncbi:DUF3726 domain-containing protein [Pelagibacteraceae bacterium]|nr:DUF3726 domain-containing protein [Pelagibacteraceae bacterium]|tara:strand:+ start:1092 stop:1676 length:585 start_codon:yes stop_codon:yes gene_type:complete
MRTSSEIETISKRASRAAGFTWGISEEIGKCIKSLELYQISGLENLNDYLKKIKNLEPKGLQKIENKNSLKEGNFCPIYTGIALMDASSRIMELKTLSIQPVDFPILLIPFLNRISYKIGKMIEVKFDKIEILLNLNNYISSNTDLRKKILKSTEYLTINVIENKDTFDASVWDSLYELSTETFVEESESYHHY